MDEEKKGAIFKCETCAKASGLSQPLRPTPRGAPLRFSHLSPTNSGGGTDLSTSQASYHSLWCSYLSSRLLIMPTTSVRPPTTTKLYPPRTNVTTISSFGGM
ncbi:hypothetical protein M422DRAFT_242806 [Sphaerobolus stellatus SS14]|nr:hypothetical protein M422DRAFT_242806 [Sphaerobolus stellatus SS14]